MLSIIYQSPFYNLSGYASESRGLVRELVQRGFTVKIHHAGKESPAALPPEEVAFLRGLEATPADPTESLCIFSQPLFYARRPPGIRWAVLRSMFETERIHPQWAERCDHFDEVWVPSAQNREAFVASGLPSEKVRWVPGGIDTDLFRPGLPPFPLARRKEYAFLSVFDWQWRKGWDLLLTAYCQEFRPEEPVTLYLKVPDLTDQSAPLGELFYFLRQRLQIEPEATPDIVLVDADLTDQQMAGLYNAVDALVLPTRGEGYGRPFLEAMACQLPVIGTAWGGQADFLTAETGYPLPIRGLEPVPAFDREWYRGLRWAAPDPVELQRLMRHLYRNRAEARRKGKAARDLVVGGWDSRVVGAVLEAEIRRFWNERGPQRGGLGAAGGV